MYPQYIGKLILITTSPRFPDEQGIDSMIETSVQALEKSKLEPVKTYWEQARFFFHQKFRKEMESNPNKKFYGIWSPMDLINENSINPPRTQDIRNKWNSIKNHDTFNRLNEIKHKTLLIAASHDRLTPKMSMEQMHEIIPNSQLKIIPKSGHFCHLSNANEFNQIILEFLER
jgi:pimeloyl-ACP methyl ester carboxylesterase